MGARRSALTYSMNVRSPKKIWKGKSRTNHPNMPFYLFYKRNFYQGLKHLNKIENPNMVDYFPLRRARLARMVGLIRMNPPRHGWSHTPSTLRSRSNVLKLGRMRIFFWDVYGRLNNERIFYKH